MLNGSLDEVARHLITGWAQETDSPETPVKLAVSVDDTLVFRVVANRYRQDLEEAGLGSGRHSFNVNVASGVLPPQDCVVRIFREEDGMDIPGSPMRLGGTVTFDQPARKGLSALLEAPGSPAELQDRATYLASETERLLQRLADHRSQRLQRAGYRQQQWRWKPGATPPAESRTFPMRALVIDATIPALQRDAGSNAILSHMGSLQRLGFEVAFIPADLRSDGVELLQARGITAYCTPWIASVEEVLRREFGTFDLVYLHRYDVAARYVALARQYMPKARLVFSVADLHHLRLLRQAQVENRPELATHAKYVRSQELIAASSVNAVVTHSTAEATLLQRYLPDAQVNVVPWAVPLRPTTRPLQERQGLAFIGNYAHQPNVDAAVWLVQDIMPLIRRHDPTITCLLVGSNMPDSLRALAQPGVEALGAVADLAEVFNRVRLTVAPLAYGAGAKGKVLDSLAAGVPCVCTAIAAEGLNLPAELQPLIAADIPAFAAAAAKLHADAGLNKQLGLAGLRYVASYLQEPRIDSLLRQVTGIPSSEALVRDEAAVAPAPQPAPAAPVPPPAVPLPPKPPAPPSPKPLPVAAPKPPRPAPAARAPSRPEPPPKPAATAPKRRAAPAAQKAAPSAPPRKPAAAKPARSPASKGRGR